MLRRFIRYSCIYEVHMSPTLSRSSAIRRFKHSNAIEICDGIPFDFYTGLPHMYDFTSLDYTKTWLTCTGWYTQLHLLVQIKPAIAQDVTLIWPKQIFQEEPTSGCCFDITLMPKINFCWSRLMSLFGHWFATSKPPVCVPQGV